MEFWNCEHNWRCPISLLQHTRLAQGIELVDISSPPTIVLSKYTKISSNRNPACLSFILHQMLGIRIFDLAVIRNVLVTIKTLHHIIVHCKAWLLCVMTNDNVRIEIDWNKTSGLLLLCIKYSQGWNWISKFNRLGEICFAQGLLYAQNSDRILIISEITAHHAQLLQLHNS